MIRCPNCTAQLEFNVESQKVTCDYCGCTFNPKELKEEVKKAKEEVKKAKEEVKKEKEDEKVETYEGKSYSCSQCGATLLTFDETAITFCSYCGSQAMIESKLIKRNNPQYIIPFKKTKEECINAYKKKLSELFFVPNYMKSDIVIEKFRGIYIPYCIYKLSFHGYTSNKGSKYSHRRGDYQYYDDYKIDAKIDADYNGISYDVLSNLYDRFSHSIPHNFKEAEKFNTNYLAGFYADTVDVSDHIYEDNAITIANTDSTNQLLKQKEYLNHGCYNPKVNFSVSEKNMGMFPLYFLAIRDKKEEYVNYAIVNGQTGKVVADLPVDFKKYVLASLLLTIPIYIVINLLLVVIPQYVCAISLVSAIISLIISIVQMNKINKREKHLDDEGYTYINEEKKTKKAKKIKFKYIYKQLIAIVLSTIILFSGLVHDAYYYGASIITLFLVILSFYDLTKEHNLLVSTKLPQLEKRGGNEDE